MGRETSVQTDESWRTYDDPLGERRRRVKAARGEGWTVKEVAAWLGVAKRTIYRDIAYLGIKRQTYVTGDKCPHCGGEL